MAITRRSWLLWFRDRCSVHEHQGQASGGKLSCRIRTVFSRSRWRRDSEKSNDFVDPGRGAEVVCTLLSLSHDWVPVGHNNAELENVV